MKTKKDIQELFLNQSKYHHTDTQFDSLYIDWIEQKLLSLLNAEEKDFKDFHK